LKITPSPNNSVVHSVTGARAVTSNQAGPASSGKSTVELSPAARQLASLQNSDNDINLQRVQEIRDAIAAGRLKVDTERIADSLLASARELLK